MSSGTARHDGAGVTYGIDIGGTKVLGVALAPDNVTVGEARVPTPTGKREIVGSHVAEAVARVTAELDGNLGPDASSAPIGVGAPGMVDRRGRLCFAPNLPQAHGVDWTALIGDRLPGRAVVIENDAMQRKFANLAYWQQASVWWLIPLLIAFLINQAIVHQYKIDASWQLNWKIERTFEGKISLTPTNHPPPQQQTQPPPPPPQFPD